MREDAQIALCSHRLVFAVQVSVKTAAGSFSLFQAVEPDDRRAQRPCEFDDLEVSDPSRPGLDPRDRESVDVPSLPLAPCRKLRLRQTVMVTNPPHLFTDHVLSLGHLCAFEHRSLAESWSSMCARTRNNGVDDMSTRNDSAKR